MGGTSEDDFIDNLLASLSEPQHQHQQQQQQKNKTQGKSTDSPILESTAIAAAAAEISSTLNDNSSSMNEADLMNLLKDAVNQLPPSPTVQTDATNSEEEEDVDDDDGEDEKETDAVDDDAGEGEDAVGVRCGEQGQREQQCQNARGVDDTDNKGQKRRRRHRHQYQRRRRRDNSDNPTPEEIETIKKEIADDDTILLNVTDCNRLLTECIHSLAPILLSQNSIIPERKRVAGLNSQEVIAAAEANLLDSYQKHQQLRQSHHTHQQTPHAAAIKTLKNMLLKIADVESSILTSALNLIENQGNRLNTDGGDVISAAATNPATSLRILAGWLDSRPHTCTPSMSYTGEYRLSEPAGTHFATLLEKSSAAMSLVAISLTVMFSQYALEDALTCAATANITVAKCNPIELCRAIADIQDTSTRVSTSGVCNLVADVVDTLLLLDCRHRRRNEAKRSRSDVESSSSSSEDGAGVEGNKKSRRSYNNDDDKICPRDPLSIIVEKTNHAAENVAGSVATAAANAETDEEGVDSTEASIFSKVLECLRETGTAFLNMASLSSTLRVRRAASTNENKGGDEFAQDLANLSKNHAGLMGVTLDILRGREPDAADEEECNSEEDDNENNTDEIGGEVSIGDEKRRCRRCVVSLMTAFKILGGVGIERGISCDNALVGGEKPEATIRLMTILDANMSLVGSVATCFASFFSMYTLGDIFEGGKAKEQLSTPSRTTANETSIVRRVGEAVPKLNLTLAFKIASDVLKLFTK